MSMKADIIAAIQVIADATENVNIRVALGAFGDVVKLSTGTLEDTGQALNESKTAQIFPTVIEGIAKYLSEAGGVGPKPIQVINSDYTVQVGQSIVQIDGTVSAPITVSLPKAADFKAGNFLLIKDAGKIGALNTLTIDPDGSETIEGSGTKVYNTPYTWCWIYSDGAKWLISSSS